MPRPKPNTNLVRWLKQELHTNDNGKYTKKLRARKFDPDNKLTPPHGGASSSSAPPWTWKGLDMFDKLERANKLLRPARTTNLSKEAFKSNPLPFFMALLDKLVKVMDSSLVQALPTPNGVAFFTTKFRWVNSTDDELDTNVCMPWNKAKVKRAQDMYVARGYLYLKLGDGPRKEPEQPGGEPGKEQPCMEYAHRVVCFLFKGPHHLKTKMRSHIGVTTRSA